MNTERIAIDARTLGIKLGQKLIEAEKLVNDGGPWNGKKLNHLSAEINHLSGTLDGIYFAAHSLLSQEDFNLFVLQTGIDATLIHEGVERITDNI
jgi:hypothetical protein